jgi:hypothetical protein
MEQFTLQLTCHDGEQACERRRAAILPLDGVLPSGGQEGRLGLTALSADSERTIREGDEQ